MGAVSPTHPSARSLDEPLSQAAGEATQEFRVVKLGGGKGLDIDAVLRDLAALQQPWVLVHGGNAELNEVSERMGHKPRFVTSPSGFTSRVTDPETIKLIQMVY